MGPTPRSKAVGTEWSEARLRAMIALDCISPRHLPFEKLVLLIEFRLGDAAGKINRTDSGYSLFFLDEYSTTDLELLLGDIESYRRQRDLFDHLFPELAEVEQSPLHPSKITENQQSPSEGIAQIDNQNRQLRQGYVEIPQETSEGTESQPLDFEATYAESSTLRREEILSSSESVLSATPETISEYYSPQISDIDDEGSSGEYQKQSIYDNGSNDKSSGEPISEPVTPRSVVDALPKIDSILDVQPPWKTRRQKIKSRKAIRAERENCLETLHRQSYLAFKHQANTSGHDVEKKLTEIFRDVRSMPPDLPVSPDCEAAIASHTLPKWNQISTREDPRQQILLGLLALRSQAFLVLQNFDYLISSGFAEGRINILVLIQEEWRVEDKDPVAELKPLLRSTLQEMISDLIVIMYDLCEVRSPGLEVGKIVTYLGKLIAACGLAFPFGWKITSFIDETVHISEKSMSTALKNALLTTSQLMRLTVEIFDLGIMTFAEGHIGPSFNNETFKIETGLITLPVNSSICTARLIKLQRLPLKCLGRMLGEQTVWVFQQGDNASFEELNVLTKIEAFSDVWGPVWSIKDKENPDLIAQYDVGGGTIVPWRPELSGYPEQAEGVRICHWLSPDELFHAQSVLPSDSSESSESSESDELFNPYIDPKGFDGSESLLIGAKSVPALQWRECRCSIDEIRRQLKQSGRLDRIIASKANRSIDSQQVALVGGSHGLTVGKSITYKDKKEETLKQSFLDMWKHEPQSRDPRELENFWGVIVSLCTLNARRVRLVEMLGKASVIGLLHSFEWSDRMWNDQLKDFESPKRDRFFEAIQDPNYRAFGDLWEQSPEWQKELGDVLQICLATLSRTGYDPYRDEFHVLWMPPKAERGRSSNRQYKRLRGARRVTLKPSDQSWVRFLRDTTYSMTMAVMVEGSLGARHVCREVRPYPDVPSLLETAICVNRELDPFRQLRVAPCRQDPCEWIWGNRCTRWRSVWDVSHVKNGDHVWTGAQIRLKVVTSMNRWSLLLKWDSVVRDRIRDLIGLKPAERISHWEFTDEEEEDGETRPIPVHIKS